MDYNFADPRPRYDPQFVRRELWFLSRSLRRAIELVDGDIMRAIVFMIVARISAGDWCDGKGVLAAPRARSFCTANTVAESLGWPFETVRRHLGRLVRMNLCQRTSAGFALITEGPNQPPIAEFLVATRDHLFDFIADLVADGIAEDTAQAANANFAQLVQASLDLSLAPVEFNRKAQPDWPKVLIYGFVVVLSSRHVADNRALWISLGDQIVPDAMREPVSIAQMAQFLHQPYSSIHRHMTLLADAGMLTRRGKGYIIPADLMLAKQTAAGTFQRVQYTRGILRRLGHA